MRTILRIAAILLFSLQVNAQYITVTNLFGTTAYGSENVTVTSAGSVSSIPYCGVNPYWIGSGSTGPGSYTFSFSSPVKAVRVLVTAMDVGFGGLDTEKIRLDINGVFYSMTTANLTTYGGTCGQPTEPIIGGLLVCTIDLGFGGGGQLDVAQCGINSCTVWANGVLNGSTFTFMFDSVRNCFRAWDNSPCVGDTLRLKAIGDSTGATYMWSGPGGFTSTLQNPFKFPTTWADTGIYTVVRTVGIGHDTATDHVILHPPPVVVVSNNSPLCAGMLDTLFLGVTPVSAGETFVWTGPNAFTSTLSNPQINGFAPTDTGYYKIIARTSFGCRDSALTHVTLVAPPPAITINGIWNYCQGVPFTPFTTTGVTGTVLWYTSATGGTGSTIAPVINTLIPGTYKFWASQIIGSCESPRSSITVKVTTTPPAPPVSGTTQYCQHIGPVVPLNVTLTTTSATVNWYTVATGGTTGIHIEPLPNINTSGTYNYWVSQTDSGCEGPRTPVTISIHPKPSPPIIIATPACQFWIPGQLNGSPSGAGDILKWYGPGVVPGSLIAPTPSTSVAPDTATYYVTETSIYGCVSDSAVDKQITKEKPAPPHTQDTKYCQHASPVAPLNTLVDSLPNATLKWYYNMLPLAPTPLPFTDTFPGVYQWRVSQVVDLCESDSAAINVTVIYLPKFSIEASSPWVCQFDSIQLAYKGPGLFAPAYAWTLPMGAHVVNFTNTADSLIYVRFDSANQNTFIVNLRVSDDSGFCFSDTTTTIKVVKQPTMTAFTSPDICLGDTVQLGLISRSSNAYSYKWYVDNVLMTSSNAMNLVTGNSNTGGPFLVSWTDTGKHIIKITTVTQEGCKSEPAFDSVLVHNVPESSFMISSLTSTKLCLEDSVEFTANYVNYNYSYTWAPARFFNNVNKPTIWGKMQDTHSIVTLTVTDPYGCYSTQSMEVDPGTCCTVAFPNAFTPNGDNKNDVFRPNYQGYHRFHQFRIANRWGQTIYDAANTADANWDGNFNGVPQDMGVYYYYIKYDCGGKTLEQKGDVTLIR